MAILFFDLDGTLTDSVRDLSDSINEVRRLHGLSPNDLATNRSCIGCGVEILLRIAIPEYASDDAMQEVLLREMRSVYDRNLLNTTRLYPNVRETLMKLHSRFSLILASNKNTESSCRILNALEIRPLFSEVLGSCRKPSPDALLKTMAEACCLPDDCWMIGDNWTDMEAARAAGCRGCFCNYGYGAPKDNSFRAIISEFSQLISLL